MNKVNRLVLCREDYKSQEEFENEIKNCYVAMNANYIMSIKYGDGRDVGIAVIDYNYNDLEYEDRYPY